MLELIQAVMGIMTKMIPDFMAKREDVRFNEIGAELFLFYVEVNEMLICAQEITGLLEHSVSIMEHQALHQPDEDVPRVFRRDIVSRTSWQIVSLGRIREMLQRWSNQLWIVNADAIGRLAPLLSNKESALSALLSYMGNERLPLSIRLDNLGSEKKFFDREDLDYYSIPEERYRKLIKYSIPLQPPWGADVCDVIKKYLEESDPKVRIERIRGALDDLRSALLDTFTIKDVLLAVGDRRYNRWSAVRRGGSGW